MKFITDGALGKLAKWLRILGYDTEYCRSSSIPQMLRKSLSEDRIILTRNTRLGEYKAARNYILIKDDILPEQLKQLISKLKLTIDQEPFRRCLICNHEIVSVAKEEVKPYVPDFTYQTQEVFYRCSNCQKIYWRGTHFRNTQHKLRLLKNCSADL